MSTSELFEAFEADPTDHKAFEALVKSMIDEEDRAGLQAIYDRLPEWAPDGESSRIFQVLAQQARLQKDSDIGTFLHFQNGLALWKQFGDPKKAEMSFRKMKGVPPDTELLKEFYLEFYVEQNNWRRLEQFLSDPELGGMDDELEVKRLLARLAEEKDQDDKAVTYWQAVYKDDPTDVEAEESLRRLYAAVGKWHAMVDLLKDKLKACDDDQVDEQIAIHMEMIEIYKTELNAASKAISSWQSILDLQPTNREALDALADEYTEMKRWPDLVKVLQAKAEVVDDVEKMIDLHKQIAEIMLDKFNNASEAIRSYEAILELDPSNAEAIRFLKDLYEQRRDFDSYIRVSEREVELLPEGEARNEAYITLAQLATEKIRKPEQPIILWERVLEFDPQHGEALENLEQLYEREKNYEQLVRILESRAELSDDPSDKVSLLEKLGQTYSSRLDDENRAAEAWRRVLELDPEHRKAQAELKKKYTNEGDWENLEWFFRNYATVQDWVRTLESQAKSVDDPSDRTTLLFKAAAVWQDELGETRRAVKNLEAVLEIEPRHGQAARMLVPIYRDIESWDSLPAVYDIVLESTEDPDERQQLLLALADVQENHLRDVDSAFFAYVQAVQERPNHTQLHGELKRLAEASGNWDSYVMALQENVAYIEDPADKIAVLLEVGHVYRDRLNIPDTALEYFNRVIALDDTNRPALNALEVLYGDTGAYDQLIGVLDRKLRIALSDDERKELLFSLARVWRDNLGNNEEAGAIYRQMLEEFPTDTGVHDALIGIYLEEGNYAELRDVLERKRDILLGEDVHRTVLADVECNLGMLAYGTSPDEAGVERAVDHYEMALDHEPRHGETVARLEELLADEGQRLRITRLLEPVYEDRAAWHELADVLEIQLQSAAEADDTLEQVALLERLAKLYREQLDDEDLAWRSYGRLFVHQPGREDVRDEFERLTAHLGRWPELVELYTDRCEEPVEAQQRLAIKLIVARAWHKRIEDLEKARIFYHKVLEEEAEHNEAIDALEHIYIALDKAEELLDIYRRKVELGHEVEQKLDYLFRTSDLLRDRLQQYDDAIFAAQEALDHAPGHLPALQRLDELYTITESWDDLSRILEDTIDLVREDEERVVVLQTRLAGVREHCLSDVAGAIELYSGIFQVSPENQATLEALERLFEMPEWAPRIAPTLEPYYERAGDWPKLIEIYTVRESAADDPFQKVQWHYKIAELYETSGNMPESAFEHYMLAATQDPGSEQTLGELLRLAETLGNHSELILHLQSLVDQIDFDDRRRETHRTIARLCRDKTQDIAGREKHLREILDISPDDMEAIDDLIALYREQDDSEHLVEMLLVKAPMVMDQEAKQLLYSEAGDLSARVLDDPTRAISIYEELHALDPSQDKALTALEELYERTERWEDLNEVYRQRIDRSEDLDTRKYYASLRGQVQAERQGNLDDAIMTWRQILDWDPQEIAALHQLDELYTRQEDWFSLLDVLRKMQEVLDEQGWAEAQFRVAKLFESDDHLADIHQAIQAYGALLDRFEGHIDAIEALKAIIARREEREAAFEVLKPHLVRSGAFEELWQQYETIAAHQEDDIFRKVETLHQMARLAEGELGDPMRAFAAQARAFKLDMQNQQTVAELERLATEHGLWEELVSLYSQGAEDAVDDFAATNLRLKTGAILMDRIGDAERAIDVYSRIYEDNPDHPDALQRLHGLYEHQGMYQELVKVLRNQFDTALEPADKIGFLTKLARVSEEHLGNHDAAYEAYVEVLYLDERSELAIAELQRLFNMGIHRMEIAERLEPIYSEREAWEDLHGLLEGKLDAMEDPLDKLMIMRQLAELNLNRLGSKPEAIVWYGRAFRVDPEDEGLYAQLRTLAEETDRWAEVKQILMDGASAVEDDERRVELWLRAAEITRDRLGDLAEAEHVFRLVLDQDEENFRALKALDAIYVAAERWEDLEAVLSKEARVAEFDDQRIELLVRLAQLYRGLGRRDDAIEAYREVLDLNDMHRDTLLALRQMYHEDQRWEDLYGVLQRLVDATVDDAERGAWTADMARIAEASLDRAEDAVNLWEDVLMITPGNVQAIHELQRLLETQENWQGLVDAFDRELNMGVEDPTRRLDLYKRIGRVWQHRLEDMLQAQTYWERAREEDPHDRETLEALRAAYRDNYAFEQLGGVLVAQLQSGHYEPEEQLALWRELAEIRTDQLGDAEGAIEAWRAVLSLSSGDEDAIENLERLFEQEQMFADAVELHRYKLQFVEDEAERITAWLYVATLQEEKLQDKGAAAATYQDILNYKPDSLDASQRLETIYEQGEQWSELAQLLGSRVEHLEEVEDKMLCLQRLAKIYEDRLEAPSYAFDVLDMAVQLVPSELNTREELARLAELTGSWEKLVDTYDFLLEQLAEDEITCQDILLRAAAVQRDKVANPADSAAYYGRVLEMDPESERALRPLVDLNEQLERWEALVSNLTTLAEVTMDYEEKKQLYARAADVLERQAQDLDRAVQAWEALLEIDEVDRQALTALERLHTERRDWHALIDVIERIARTEPQREGELKLRVAEIREQLGEVDAAIETYEEVLAFDPANETALDALEALYGEREDWNKLVDVYERSYDAATTDQGRADICRKIAILHQAVFENPDDAAEAYQRILYLVPGDEDAIAALEKIYVNGQRWEDLVELYEKKYEVAQGPEGRAEALSSMAEAYRTHLGDTDNAVATYERLLAEVSGHRPALEALDGLYQETLMWDRVIDVIERKLAVETDRQARLDMLTRQGRIRQNELADPHGATQHYERALAERPGYDPAIDALVEIHSEDENWPSVVEVLGRKLATLTAPQEQAQVHVRLADVLRDKLGEEERALHHLEMAVEGDPESEATLWPLADHYIAVKNWTKAMPLLDVLVDKLDEQGDRTRLAKVHRRLGLCAEAVFDNDRALDEYRAAIELAPPELDTLRGLARLTFKKENWSESQRYHQQILERYQSELTSDELVQMYLRLGEASLKLGDIAQAQRYLNDVIEQQPENADAMEQIAQVLEAHGDWSTAIEYKRQLLTLKNEPLEKFTLEMQIGDIYREHVKDQNAAIDAYKKALDHGTFSKAPLLQLVAIYAEQRNFTEAIRTLNGLIQQEDDATKKARYAWTAAVMYRDQLDDSEQAVKYLNLVLDYDLNKLEAFQAVDKLLTDAKQWKPLEQNYRRMIQRVQKAGSAFEKGPALLYMLYKNLGEVYRSRLKRNDYAISAFELAVKQRPKEQKIREILAELYQAVGQPDKAVEQHQILIAEDPQRYESYHTLVGLYKDAKQYDKAWCTAGLLCTLDRASDEDAKFYHEYVGGGLVETNRMLDDNAWFSMVMSPGEERLMGEIFSIIYQMLGKAIGQRTLKDLGLKKKDKLDLEQGSMFGSVLMNVARVLNIQPPDIYVSQTRMGIEILPTYPTVMSVGGDMLSGKGEKELGFHLAKRLTYMHRWHRLAALYDHKALDILFMAAAAVADPGYALPLPPDMPEDAKQMIAQQVGETKATLDSNTTTQLRTQLQQLFAEFWSRNAAPRIGRWHRQVELTANHAGLLIVDDIQEVGRILKMEVSGTSKLSRGEKLKDLVMYGLSERWFKLREHMGIQIDYSELFG